MKKLLATILLTLCISIFCLQTAGAYSIDKDLRPINEPFNITNEDTGPAGSGTAIAILQVIAGGLIYFAAPVAVIMIAAAAFQMVSGGADSEQVEQAKKNLTWSIAGLVLIILSYSIVRFAIGFAQQAGDRAKLADPTSIESTEETNKNDT